MTSTGTPHKDQEKNIEDHKNTAAILSGDIREFPHISDPDGAARTYQQKSKS